jgi:hypothetical protein
MEELIFDGVNFTLTRDANIFTKTFKTNISNQLKTNLEYLFKRRKFVKDYIITPEELIYDNKKEPIGYKFTYVNAIHNNTYLLNNAINYPDRINLLEKLGNCYYKLRQYDITVNNNTIGLNGDNPIFVNTELCDVGAADKEKKYFIQQAFLFLTVVKILVGTSFNYFNVETYQQLWNDLKPLIPEWFYNILTDISNKLFGSDRDTAILNYEFKDYYDKIMALDYNNIHNNDKWNYYKTIGDETVLINGELSRFESDYVNVNDNRILFSDFENDNMIITVCYCDKIGSIQEKTQYLIRLSNALKPFYNIPLKIVNKDGGFYGYKVKYNKLQHQEIMSLLFENSDELEYNYLFYPDNLIKQLSSDSSKVFPLFFKLSNAIKILNNYGIIYTNIDYRNILVENNTILIDDLGLARVVEYGEFKYSDDVNSFYKDSKKHKNVDRAMVFVYFIEYLTKIQFYKLIPVSQYKNFISMLKDYVPTSVLELFYQVIDFNTEFTGYLHDYEEILNVIDTEKIKEFYTYFMEHKNNL